MPFVERAAVLLSVCLRCGSGEFGVLFSEDLQVPVLCVYARSGGTRSSLVGERTAHALPDVMNLDKLRYLGRVFRRDPREGAARIKAYIENRYGALSQQAAGLSCVELSAVKRLLDEYREPDRPSIDEGIDCVQAQIETRLRQLPATAPFHAGHSADMVFGRMCYMACRAFRPDIVIETGVAYGVTTSFIP